MIQNEAVAALPIQELPSVVVQLFERARQPLLPGTQGQDGLFVRYLRGKPGRGLGVVYNASPLISSRGTRSRTPERWVSLTLGEAALGGTQIRFAARQAQEAALEAQPPGVLRIPDLDLVVQAFPADDVLPGLAASCTPARAGPLFSGLEEAARVQLRDPAWDLASPETESRRIKSSRPC